MDRAFQAGDCVCIPDGRIGRVRSVSEGRYRVRVRRTTSATHQFLMFVAKDLQRVDCPKGWMSPEGYMRYLTVTLAKMRRRNAAAKNRTANGRRKPTGASQNQPADAGRSPIKVVVLTVGHSNRSLEDFLHLLQAHQATLVVDVRKMPRSRHNPQFNCDTLPQALHEVDIDYLHLPGLGGLPAPAKFSEQRLEERFLPGVRRLHADLRVRDECARVAATRLRATSRADVR